MAVIQPALTMGILNYVDSSFQKARVKLDGKFSDYPVHRTTVIDNTVRKYIYLESEVGFVEEAQLLGANDEILARKSFAINKEEDGLALVFQFTINVQEG